MGLKLPLRVYVFRINDDDASTPTFSCVASSEAEAFEQVTRAGFEDFFLEEVKDLDELHRPDFVDHSIKINPFVGKIWEPVIRAICWSIDGSNPDRGSTEFNIQTYGSHYGASPYRSPYIQGRRRKDGSLYVELSGNIICDPPLDEKQIEQLTWIGWLPPNESPNDSPNFLRIFEPGWTSRMVAERIIEAWTSAMNISTADFFSFSRNRRDSDEVAKIDGLQRMGINEGNPNGEIFRIICAENDRMAAKDFELPLFRDANGQNWVEVSPRMFCAESALLDNNYALIRHFDSLDAEFGTNLIRQENIQKERFVLSRSFRQMRELWSAAHEEYLRATKSICDEVIATLPPSFGPESSTTSQTAQAHRIAFSLYGFSRCRLRFFLIDRAENIVRLLRDLSGSLPTGAEELDTLFAAAWLSMITQPVELGEYHRRLQTIDLRSWGIKDDVIDLLVALNPSLFDLRKDWFQALESNPLARYLAIAIELDRLVLSEIPLKKLPKRLQDVGRVRENFETPFGVTPLLRVSQTIDGLASDEVTRQWIDNVLVEPRQFWDSPANYRWGSWDEFVRHGGVGRADTSVYDFQLAFDEDPIELMGLPNLFASVDNVKSVELPFSGAMNLGLAIACSVAIEALQVEFDYQGRPIIVDLDTAEMNLELAIELIKLKTRALDEADRSGYYFIENESLTTVQIHDWLVRAGEFGLSLLAQKLRTDIGHRSDELAIDFERKDLIGQMDGAVLFATSVYVTVLQMRKAIYANNGKVDRCPESRVFAQVEQFELIDAKYFAHRQFSRGTRPCDQWLLADLQLTEHVITNFQNAAAEFYQVEEPDWDDYDPNPPDVSDEFGLYVWSLGARQRFGNQADWKQIDDALPSPTLKQAISLSVLAACHAVVNDNRPCVISIGCTAPGRIDQTVDISATFLRGVLTIECEFVGEALDAIENGNWKSSSRTDPVSPSKIIQHLVVKIDEEISSWEPGANSIFRGVEDFLSEFEKALVESQVSWDSRPVHSIVLNQSAGGFVAPVLTFYGRHFERGVVVRETAVGAG